MKKLFYASIVMTTMLIGLFLFSTRSSLAACTGGTAKQQIQCGVNSAAGGSGSNGSSKGVEDTVRQVINILSLAGGALAVIMIIVGGLRYVISAGNQEATKSAKNTIIYSVIGLIIIAVAQIIVQFVLVKTEDGVTGGNSSTSSSSGSSIPATSSAPAS